MLGKLNLLGLEIWKKKTFLFFSGVCQVTVNIRLTVPGRTKVPVLFSFCKDRWISFEIMSEIEANGVYNPQLYLEHEQTEPYHKPTRLKEMKLPIVESDFLPEFE